MASSYITAVQGIYDTLTAAQFAGGILPAGPFLDEAPVTSPAGARQSPPYVILRDMGATPKWTFTSDQVRPNGQNAIVLAEFMLEAYAFELGESDAIIRAVLWNNQIPDLRAGVAFATLSLTLPEKGMAGTVIPTKTQRGYAGFTYNNQRVHVTKQWFSVKHAISGDGA